MSVRGIRLLAEKFSVHVREFAGNSTYSFGGTHAQVVYDAVTGLVVPHTTLDGVNKVPETPNNIVSLVLIGVKPDVPAQFPNLRLEDITGSYALDLDTYAVVLEGTVDVNGTLLDANTDLYIVEPNTTLNGTAKLALFNYVQN